MMTKSQSFIDAAITKLGESATSTAGKFARVVQTQNHDQPANRIALTMLQLQRERNDARDALKATGVEQEGPVVVPEFTLSFIQELMNTICWNARRLEMANVSEDFANGIDFSQDVGAQVGVYTEHTREQVDEDFVTLNNLHTWVAGQMAYLDDIRSLAYFSRTVRVEDEDGVVDYVTEYEHFSYDDAYTEMERIVEDLREQAPLKQAAEASSIDFSAAA